MSIISQALLKAEGANFNAETTDVSAFLIEMYLNVAILPLSYMDLILVYDVQLCQFCAIFSGFTMENLLLYNLFR